MVTTKSNTTKNQVSITNNLAKYYADIAEDFLNQIQQLVEIAKITEDEIAEMLEGENLATVKNNIQAINTTADNIEDINTVVENLTTILNPVVEWGDIQGTFSAQEDLKEMLDTKADTTDIPTKVSDLENDVDFITSADIPSIPTKTSDLTNDSGFITEHQSLENYVTTAYVDSLIGDVGTILDDIIGGV